MSVKSRTIDNLGREASVRYAQDKSTLAPDLIHDSTSVSQRTTVSVFKPYVPNEFDQLFSSARTSTWADFPPPPHYFTSSRPLFTYQLMPSLGGVEKQDAILSKLEKLEDTLNKQPKKRGKDEPDEDEKKRKTLITFLQLVQQLDKTLSMINSRRNQYQRG